MKHNNKDVVISIVGSQSDGSGEDNDVELVTDGTYKYENGESTFTYRESPLTGMDGTTTSITVSPMGVVMTREGTLNTRMVFEEGKKHNFVYDTPFGAATMGINTRRIVRDMDEHGGSLEIDYLVDYQQALVGHNFFRFSVREQKDSING